MQLTFRNELTKLTRLRIERNRQTAPKSLMILFIELLKPIFNEGKNANAS